MTALWLVPAWLLAFFVPAPGPAVSGPVSTQAAPSSVQQGWWSEAQQLPAQVPVKPATGTNLVVGNDASGPNAVAAVRYLVDAAVPATLTLTMVAKGTAGTPVLAACPIHAVWNPTLGGPWADRPKYSCLLSAAGVVSGSTVTFSLGPPLQGAEGVYDLALVPRPGDTTPFVVQFAPPSSASLHVAATESPPGADEPAPAPPEFTAGDLTPFLTFDIGPLPDISPAPPSTAVLPSASRAQPVVAAGPTPPLPAQRVQRAIALSTLLLMVLVVWWFGGGPVRSPRRLGPLGRSGEGGEAADKITFVRTGGIGRFARPRDRLPPRL